MFSKYESMFEPGVDIDWTTVVLKSKGFSGADVHHLAQHAMMQPIRELMAQRFWEFTSGKQRVQSL
jgi:ATP-dependent 26S proteasome regulatory subunit